MLPQVYLTAGRVYEAVLTVCLEWYRTDLVDICGPGRERCPLHAASAE